MIRLLLLPWNILQNVFLVTPFIVLFVLQKCTFRFADHNSILPKIYNEFSFYTIIKAFI